MNVVEIVAGFRDGKLTQVEAVKEIKALVAAERERCAQIAENVPDDDHIDGKLSRECECLECQAVTKVADMIRA